MSNPGDEPRLAVLEKIARILDCFSMTEPELNLTNICRTTGLPTSTCQRLLQHLVQEGMLTRQGDTYRIGMRIARWSVPATQGLDVVQLLSPIAADLRDRINEAVLVAVRDGAVRCTVHVAQAPQPIQRNVAVGMVARLSELGAVSRMFLACDPAALAAAEADGLVVDEVLREQLALARRDRYTASIQEREPGTAGAAVPIVDHAGRLLAVMAVAGPSARMDGTDWQARLRQELTRARERADLQLGVVPPVH